MAYKRKRKYAWQKDAPKTNHNSKKPFNPKKYGEVWNTIRFEHDWGRTPQGDSKMPVIGKLFIGDKYTEITFSEANRIIDTLRDAQHAHNVGVRLGRTNSHAGVKDYMAHATSTK